MDRQGQSLKLLPVEEQPEVVDLPLVDGVQIKKITVRYKHTVLPQHSHAYDHITLIMQGAVLVVTDHQRLGTFKAGEAITIRANTKHEFLTLEDCTIFCCVHNTSRTGTVEVAEEHQFGLD